MIPKVVTEIFTRYAESVERAMSKAGGVALLEVHRPVMLKPNSLWLI